MNSAEMLYLKVHKKTAQEKILISLVIYVFLILQIMSLEFKSIVLWILNEPLSISNPYTDWSGLNLNENSLNKNRTEIFH